MACNFEPIEKKLRELASGLWVDPRKVKSGQKEDFRIPIHGSRCGKQTIILWQVDVAADEVGQGQSQVLKIWEIGGPSEVPQFTQRIMILQKTYSAKDTERCCKTPIKNTENRALPRVFNDATESSSSEPGTNLLDVTTTDKEVLQLVNRFFTLTEPMIQSILTRDVFAEFPFDFSGVEARIILQSTSSSLILGRSGTGKTTCLVYKLLARYIAGSDLQLGRRPRQVLLTRSNELALKLRDYIIKLLNTIYAANTALGDRGNINYAQSLDNDADGNPPTIYDLKDEHFPLICTFSNFLALLENSIRRSREGINPVLDEVQDDDQAGFGWNEESSGETKPLDPLQNDEIERLVDFSSFKINYWSRFPPSLIQKVPTELAFAEIMGVIKGSKLSRETLAPLSEIEYSQLSSRLAPTFSNQTDRSRLYEIYQKYERLKSARGELDDIDRIVSLLRSFRQQPALLDYFAMTLDDIYVDEVQDLRTIEIEILLSLLEDGTAFHFAGDTAQTISQDSTFRFEDVKALMYSHFPATATSLKQQQIEYPILFTLANNYRSHQGILALASCIIKTLWTLFPETVDKLEPEIGLVKGPLPIFLVGRDFQLSALFSEQNDSQPEQNFQFGAEQVILVRDTSTQEQLQALVGDAGLVLTILQSKGMEFEDVMLYNFFTTTPYPGGWRELKASSQDQPVLNVQRYPGMCFELKQLYVAITRPRLRLCIFEDADDLPPEIARSLRNESGDCLVDLVHASDPGFDAHFSSFRASSDDQDKWSRQGQAHLQRKNYKEAALCFRRADDKIGIITAAAYLAEIDGRICEAKNDTATAQTFFDSAVAKFLEVGLVQEASRTLEQRRQFTKAAWLWVEDQKPAQAAPLFLKGADYKSASHFFNEAQNFDAAANALRRGILADDLVLYVTTNKQKLSEGCLKTHSRYCLLLLKREQISIEIKTRAISLLGSTQEQEAAFRQFKMNDHLCDLYQREGRFEECFLDLFERGKLEPALMVLEKSDRISEVNRRKLERAQHFHYAASLVQMSFEQRTPNKDLKMLQQSKWASAWLSNVSDEDLSILQFAEAVDSGIVRDFLHVGLVSTISLGSRDIVRDERILDTFITAARVLDRVSANAELVQEEVVLLLAGMLQIETTTSQFILLPWSPLAQSGHEMSSGDLLSIVNHWFMNLMGDSLLRFHDLLKEHWRSSWPINCANFLARGYCPRQANDKCHFSHKQIKKSDCDNKLSSLMKIGITFCIWTKVYDRRIMNVRFQINFTGIRRLWLESIFRECIFISSLENSSRTVNAFSSKILDARRLGEEKDFLILLNGLENLLFHKLGRSNYIELDTSSLFEQYQLSQIFGREADPTWIRIYMNELLHKVRDLEYYTGSTDHAAFRENLHLFISLVLRTNADNYQSFHSITTTFEFFAAYLIYKASRVAFIVPQSWLDLHFPWFASYFQISDDRALNTRDYAEILIDLVAGFCTILARASLPQGTGFRLGNSTYPSLLLHRRNAELLALATVNLNLNNPGMVRFGGVWQEVKQIISIPLMKCSHLNHGSMPDLLDKLASSFKSYDDKDSLKLVRISAGYYAADNKAKSLGISTVLINEVVDNASSFIESRVLSERQSATEAEETDQQRRQAEAVSTICQFWKRQIPKLRESKEYLNSGLGRLRAKLLSFCVTETLTLTERMKVRAFLSEDVVQLQSDVQNMTQALSKIQEEVMQLLNYASQDDQFDSVDEVSRQITLVEDSLARLQLEAPLSMVSLESYMKKARASYELEELILLTRASIEALSSDLCVTCSLITTVLEERGMSAEAANNLEEAHALLLGNHTNLPNNALVNPSNLKDVLYGKA
ncbi:MAG: hypothetical protein M1814_001483 [Vezdaea aestivalis]|nr:MAG: hypothetical protein M1814_001483 [Vezdaea aestivalis]